MKFTANNIDRLVWIPCMYPRPSCQIQIFIIPSALFRLISVLSKKAGFGILRQHSLNMSFYTQKSEVELVIHVNKLFFSVEIDPHVRYLNHSGTERINWFTKKPLKC